MDKLFLFSTNCRFQVAALCIFVIVLFFYARYRKLPSLSTKCFKATYAFALVNVIFDILTVYTVTHVDTVPEWLNRLLHQFFIGTLNATMYCFFLYVFIKGTKQRHPSRLQLFAITIPLLVSLGAIVFGDINYVSNERGLYSYGLMPYTVYFIAVLYQIASVVVTFIPYFKFAPNDKISIRFGSAMCLGVTAIQLFNPYFLLSGLGIALMIAVQLIAFENPRELYDDNTGLFNKKAYELALSDFMGTKTEFCLVDISISNIQHIYSKYGHDFAHRLMTEIGKVLTENYGYYYVYHSRSGAFSVILNRHKYNTDQVGDTLNDIMCRSWNVDGTMVSVESVVNMLDCPDYSNNIDEVLDIIEYMSQHAKSDGRDCIVQKITDGDFKAQERYMTIYEILKDALKNDGINVFFQPIYSAKLGRFASAEALVRLKDTETIGFISPEEFIRIAEEKGLIIELGDKIFELVCKFASENKIKDTGVDYIEVNVSGVQGVDTGLPQRFSDIMKKYAISPEFFNLEITETAAVEGTDLLQNNMKKLTSLGCTFSMDDFGTGFSNIANLAETNYELIKFDKSLIWPYFQNDDPKHKVILPHLIKLINNIGSKIVAEGVETKEMADMLIENGVSYLQGYYYSRPLPGEGYLEFLRINNK